MGAIGLADALWGNHVYGDSVSVVSRKTWPADVLRVEYAIDQPEALVASSVTPVPDEVDLSLGSGAHDVPTGTIFGTEQDGRLLIGMRLKDLAEPNDGEAWELTVAARVQDDGSVTYPWYPSLTDEVAAFTTFVAEARPDINTAIDLLAAWETETTTGPVASPELEDLYTLFTAPKND